MVDSRFCCWLWNGLRIRICVAFALLFLTYPANGQVYELGQKNGYRLKVEVIRTLLNNAADDVPDFETVRCLFTRVDQKTGEARTWEENMGPGFRVDVRAADYLHRNRKQLWVGLIHGAPDARLFDFDGERVTTVYETNYPNAGRVYPEPRITSHGGFEILEEFDQEYEEDIFGPGLFNPETNLTERLIQWDGSKFIPVDVLKLPTAKQTPRAKRVKKYERLLHSLVIGKPQVQVKESLRTLKKAGRDAFPVLLEHLDDRTRVHRRAVSQQASKVSAIHTGSFQPTMGDACFGILQEVIEGKWPERFTPYHALTRENVSSWVETKLREDLESLRRLAAEDAIRFAHEEPPPGVDTALHKEAMEFITKRLKELKP